MIGHGERKGIKDVLDAFPAARIAPGDRWSLVTFPDA